MYTALLCCQETEWEEATARPRPMAGFRLGSAPSLRKAASAPAALLSGSTQHQPPLVYFPVPLDTEELVDWQEGCGEENNNEKEGRQKAALVTVNSTDVAVFRFGDSVLGEFCPARGCLS